MVRMRTREFGVRPNRDSAITVSFVGPIGHGVGMAADILAEVAEATHRTVDRRRSMAAQNHDDLVSTNALLQVVRIESGQSVERGLSVRFEPTELVVAWNVEAAMASAHLLNTPDDLILIETQAVPQWRLGWSIDDGMRRSDVVACQSTKQPAGLFTAARALGLLSRRLPFAVQQWRQVLPRYAPAKHAATALDHFLAASW